MSKHKSAAVVAAELQVWLAKRNAAFDEEERPALAHKQAGAALAEAKLSVPMRADKLKERVREMARERRVAIAADVRVQLKALKAEVAITLAAIDAKAEATISKASAAVDAAARAMSHSDGHARADRLPPYWAGLVKATKEYEAKLEAQRAAKHARGD